MPRPGPTVFRKTLRPIDEFFGRSDHEREFFCADIPLFSINEYYSSPTNIFWRPDSRGGPLYRNQGKVSANLVFFPNYVFFVGKKIGTATVNIILTYILRGLIE